MDNRHELAAVFAHVPPTPLFDLIDQILPLYDSAEGRAQLPEERLIDPDASGQDGPPTEEALVEHLSAYIAADAGRDQPFPWHLARSLAIRSGHIAGSKSESRRLKAHVERDEKTLHLLDRWLKQAEHQSFPYAGCRVCRLTSEIKAEMARFSDTLSVAAFARGTGRTQPADLGVELAARLAATVFRAIAALERSPGSDADARPKPVWIRPGDGIPSDALRFVAQLLCERLALDILALVEAPVPTALCIETDDGDFETLYDLSSPPQWWTKTSKVEDLAAFVARQPHLGEHLAGQVRHALRDAPKGLVLTVAQAHPAFFVELLDTDAREHLDGAAELVAVACRITDPGKRIQALTALGAPAADALAKEVRALVPSLSDAVARDDARHRLTEAARHGHALGLRFWLNLLDKPGMFDIVWSSERLRAALMLDPAPIHRLVRRGARSAKHEPAAWEALRGLPSERADAPDLRPVAAEVVEMVQAIGPDLHQWDALKVLLLVDDEVAFEPLLELVSAYWATGSLKGRMLAWLATFEVAGSILASMTEDTHDALLEAIAETHFVAPIARPVAYVLVERFVPTRARSQLDLCCLTGGQGATRAELDASWEALEAACRAGGAEDGHIRALLGVCDASIESKSEDRRLRLLRHLMPADLADLQGGLGAMLEDLVVHGTWGSQWRRALEAVQAGLLLRVRDLDPAWEDEEGDRLAAALGEAWPTRDRLRTEAQAHSIALSETALDRFSDEALPRAFREGLRRMPGTMEAEHDFVVADPHAIVRGVMTEQWDDQPALVARHLAQVLPETDGTWRRGVVLALVALREPCGTAVPDALTKAMYAAEDAEEQAFLKAQRDTFKRTSVAIESRKPPRERVRKALKRLQIHARRA